MEDYVDDRRGRPLGLVSKWLGLASSWVWGSLRCYHDGEPIENIRHYNSIAEDVDHLCSYEMFQTFSQAVFDAIGEEAMSAAVRELYLESNSTREITTEEDIYRAFLKHAPEDRKDVFRYVYRRLHGGEYAFDAAESQAANDAAARVFDHISWFEDPPNEDHYRAAHNIFALWIRTPGLFEERIAQIAWLEDGVNYAESQAISYLADIASTDIALATMVAGYPWFTDHIITPSESQTMRWLVDLMRSDVVSATTVAALSWLRDGVTDNEELALREVRRIALFVDPELARRTVAQSWFTDGIVLSELENLRQIGE